MCIFDQSCPIQTPVTQGSWHFFFPFFFYRPKGGHYGNKDIYFCPLPYHLGYVIIFICKYLFVFIFNSLPFHLFNFAKYYFIVLFLIILAKSIYLSIYMAGLNFQSSSYLLLKQVKFQMISNAYLIQIHLYFHVIFDQRCF